MIPKWEFTDREKPRFLEYLKQWSTKPSHRSDGNWTQNHNQLIIKQELNHLLKLARWLSCVVSIICTVHLTVCSYHVTYAFQTESTL